MCRKSLAKIRLSAHNLHIQTGRYKRYEKTPIEERLCSYCLSSNIDEICFNELSQIYEAEEEFSKQNFKHY